MNAELIEQMKKDSAMFKTVAKYIDDAIAGYAMVGPYLAALQKTTPPAVVPIIGRLDYSQMSQADIVYDILSRAPNQELERHEIYKRAIEGGASIKSADHLSPIMSRDPRFMPTNRGFWAIAPTPSRNG